MAQEQQRHGCAAASVGQEVLGTVYCALSNDGYDQRPGKLNQVGVAQELRVTNKTGQEARLWNREHKILYPPVRAKWSLYLDASIRPKVDVAPLVQEWLSGHDFALMKHPHRDCAYDEIEACIAREKITKEQGEKARATLMLHGLPRKFGLWACGVMARRTQSELCDQIKALWWPFVRDLPRDQIWLPLVLHHLQARDKIRTIDADIFNNPWFTFTPHRSR